MCRWLLVLGLSASSATAAAQDPERPERRVVRTVSSGATVLGLRRIEDGPGVGELRDSDRLTAVMLGGFIGAESWRWRKGALGLRVGGSFGVTRARLRAARVDTPPLHLVPDAIHREPRGGIGPVWAGTAVLGSLVGNPSRCAFGPGVRFDWVRYGSGHEPVPYVNEDSGLVHEVPVRSIAFSIDLLFVARLGRARHAPYLTINGNLAPVVMSHRRYSGMGVGGRIGLAIPLSTTVGR